MRSHVLRVLYKFKVICSSRFWDVEKNEFKIVKFEVVLSRRIEMITKNNHKFLEFLRMYVCIEGWLISTTKNFLEFLYHHIHSEVARKKYFLEFIKGIEEILIQQIKF